MVGCQTVCASSKVCPGLPVWHTGKRDADARAPHLDRLNMGSTERGDSILGSKLCSFTTSPLCLPEAAVVAEEEAALSVLPVEINVAPRSLSLSLCSITLFLRLLSSSVEAFLFLHHSLCVTRSDVEVGDNGENWMNGRGAFRSVTEGGRRGSRRDYFFAIFRIGFSQCEE